MSYNTASYGIYYMYWKEHPERVYVGSTSESFHKRFNKHLNDMRTSVHRNIIIQNHYNKYGEPIIEVVEELICDNEYLLKREQLHMDTINSYLNIAKIAGNSKGIKRRESSKRKMALAKIKWSQLEREKIKELVIKNTPRKEIMKMYNISRGSVQRISKEGVTYLV